MHPNHEHMLRWAEDPERRARPPPGGRSPERRSRGAAAPLRRRARTRTNRASPAVVEPDRALLTGVVVETDLGPWTVHETPGHAPSHVCLFQPERRLLISGDHLLGTHLAALRLRLLPRSGRRIPALARGRGGRSRAPVPARPRTHVRRRARPHRRATASSSHERLGEDSRRDRAGRAADGVRDRAARRTTASRSPPRHRPGCSPRRSPCWLTWRSPGAPGASPASPSAGPARAPTLAR